MQRIFINLHQVIKAAGNGLVDPNRYKAIMDLYAIENKTIDSLDTMVDILEKYNKNLAKLNPSPSLPTTTQNLLQIQLRAP